jgi:biopolymer transport protein ExbD|tara:strand:- start:9273 stop:9686 length:414 start_codon:yes stop_codon:yes gene_type:complete
MSRHRRIKQAEDNTDINISPMIDMVFILLIFFIVTTVFVDEIGIKIDKPQPKPPETENEPKSDPIVFNIQANGQVLYKDDQVTMNQVEKIVRDVLSRDDVPVILEVQRNALSGLMVQVIDASYTAEEDVKISVTAVD